MKTATAVTWPTEASLEPVEKALAQALNETERLLYELGKILGPWMDKGVRPDPLPTTATVGTLYSFLETLRSEVTSIGMHADSLEQDLRQIDSLRLDVKHDAR